jgi:phosphatidylserine decarboxylase
VRPEVFLSGLGLALVLLVPLAWKWRVRASIAVAWAITVGIVAGLVAAWIDRSAGSLALAALLLIELSLIVALTALALIVRFYRDPERSPPEVENVILSPADGKVIYVNAVEPGSALVATKGPRKFRLDEIAGTGLVDNAAYLVGIDMNVLNVHVNRAPIRGGVVFRKRIGGRFMSLRRPESESINERVTTVIENGSFSVAVIQIASRLVRRIVSHVQEGDSLEIGQRIGAIVFGSQVDVVLPGLEGLRLEVKPGDDVLAGLSVIARYGRRRDDTDGGRRQNGQQV